MEITGVFLGPDRRELAVEFDGGEGGIVRVSTEYEGTEEMQSVPDGWEPMYWVLDGKVVVPAGREEG